MTEQVCRGIPFIASSNIPRFAWADDFSVIASVAKQSSAQCRPPWVASSLALLAMTQRVSRSRCDCIRVVVTPAMRSHETFRSLRRSSSEGAGGGAGAVTINASSHERKSKKKKESGTPKDADPYPLYLAVQLAPCKARSPIGVPPRFSPKGVIVPKARLQARLPGTWSERALPAIACPSPASTSRPGHNAGRLMPKPPGSGSDEPPPAGTASRPDQPGSPADVLHGERDWLPSIVCSNNCQTNFRANVRVLGKPLLHNR